MRDGFAELKRQGAEDRSLLEDVATSEVAVGSRLRNLRRAYAPVVCKPDTTRLQRLSQYR